MVPTTLAASRCECRSPAPHDRPLRARNPRRIVLAAATTIPLLALAAVHRKERHDSPASDAGPEPVALPSRSLHAHRATARDRAAGVPGGDPRAGAVGRG